MKPKNVAKLKAPKIVVDVDPDSPGAVLIQLKGRFPLRRIRPRDQVMGVSGHAQLEIQAESERLLANAPSVLEVESSSTFLRPE